jgi:hypothetical protein
VLERLMGGVGVNGMVVGHVICIIYIG